MRWGASILCCMIVCGTGCGSGNGAGDTGFDVSWSDVAIEPTDLQYQDVAEGFDQQPETPTEDPGIPGDHGDDTGTEVPGDPGDHDPGHEDLAEGPDAHDPGPGDDCQGDTGQNDEGPVQSPPLFDLPKIRDQATAQCTFTAHKTTLKNGVLVDVWKLSYQSWESIDGQLQPILIRGFASRPVGGDTIPGLVTAHGLGGFCEETHATGLAASLGTFVIAYTGPGGGTEPDNTSEGLPAGDTVTGSFYQLFDTIPDPRGSWFWGHATAALRAVTCLETRADVDPDRLGMTGGSAGAMATLMASGVDDRIKAAVPLSGTGAFAVATQSPTAWQHTLLTLSGLDTGSPQWLAFLEILDPMVLAAGTQGKVMMVNGSSDEYFPLTAHVATYDAIPGEDKRTSIAANFDHGCYTAYASILPEDEAAIQERAALRAAGGQRLWFGHWFGTDATYQYLPAAPVATAEPVGLATLVQATVDTDGGYEVEQVWFWASLHDAPLFASAEMDEQGNGIYTALVPAPLHPNMVYYVDVQYKTKSLLFPERFSLSSRPVVPDGMIPDIWPFGCF